MAEENALANGRIRFGRFEADRSSGELWRDGTPVAIQDLPFRLLMALVERPGEVVARAELTTKLWGTDTFVDAAAGLNTAIAKLRDALDDNADEPQYIETVPKRGYRFIAPVADGARPAGFDAQSERGPEAQAPSPALRRSLLWVAAAVLAVAAVAVYQLRADRGQLRVAVVLFDNETGRSEVNQLAQGLTDATVTALAAEPRLAVIGNAAVLRTPRAFRDIAKVRDALQADYIVIGQVQLVDGRVLVRAHLIRGRDQSHLWVDAVPMTSSESALQSEIAARIRAAIGAKAALR